MVCSPLVETLAVGQPELIPPIDPRKRTLLGPIREASAGEPVVTGGSFFLRAERERLGLPRAAAAAPARPDRQRVPAPAQAVKILVSEKGFEPAEVRLKAGVAARLTFVRTTDKACATEVAFPSLKIKRALPLNQPVDTDFTPAKNVDASFACGMNMFKGAVVVLDETAAVVRLRHHHYGRRVTTCRLLVNSSAAPAAMTIKDATCATERGPRTRSFTRMNSIAKRMLPARNK